MGCEQVVVDAGVIVEALGVGNAAELDKVLVAILVHGEQQEVKGRLVMTGPLVD